MPGFAQPDESRFERCTAHGCEIFDGEAFACAAKHCAHGERLCIGCTFTCADCARDFCDRCIVVLDPAAASAEARFSVYLCRPCERRRNDERKAAA